MRHAGYRHRHLHSSRASSRRTRPACRSKKWKWCLAILRFPTDRSRAVRWATGSVVPAVFAAADNAISRCCRSRRQRPDRLSRNESPMTWRFEGGRVFVKADGLGGGVPFADMLRRANLRLVTGSGRSEGTFGRKRSRSSPRTHSDVISSKSHGSRRSRGCASIALSR